MKLIRNIVGWNLRSDTRLRVEASVASDRVTYQGCNVNGGNRLISEFIMERVIMLIMQYFSHARMMLRCLLMALGDLRDFFLFFIKKLQKKYFQFRWKTV